MKFYNELKKQRKKREKNFTIKKHVNYKKYNKKPSIGTKICKEFNI